MARLADLVEKFRIDVERYFNGTLALPPEELRVQVQRALRDLRSVNLKSAVDQFRLNGVEARFNILSESFGRRLRDREEGRGTAAVRGHETERESPRYDPAAGIVLGGQALDGAAVEALYAGLARGGGAARIDLESFRGYLAKQVQDIRSKTGAERVQFRLAHEDGKIKLKAKPVTGEG